MQILGRRTSVRSAMYVRSRALGSK
uniref:Uncharacterized protein n=1 Tax=Arundo donax TaxID=35708 RepID=A0A0A9AUN8_ARUDO